MNDFVTYRSNVMRTENVGSMNGDVSLLVEVLSN